LLRIVLEWITPVLRRMWLPVAGVFGAYLLYVKGKRDQKQETKTEKIQEDLETLKRLKNVETNTDRDAALARLSKGKHLRD